MDQRLKEAAQTGNIDAFYGILGEDPYILEAIDKLPFADSPLHIAAASGHTRFVKEMMNLKPSLARKLNQDGFSPLHLALQNGHTKTVNGLVEVDAELIRVKGREGMTPLHCASERGDTDLLAEIFHACPKSIADFTIRSETALHIAVKNDMFGAFEVLMGWLQRVFFDDDINCVQKPPQFEEVATNMVEKVLNGKDEEGNTVLHIAASRNQPQVVRLLTKFRRLDINAKNLEGLTALDIIELGQRQLEMEEVRDILCCAGAYGASSLPRLTTPADRLRPKMSYYDNISRNMRIMHFIE